MRHSLLHPLADKRHPGHRRSGRLAALAQRRASTTNTRAPVESAPVSIEAPALEDAEIIHDADLTYDIAAQRVREAGGPLDEACYPCSCGYFFIAPVSTSVSCPHCGTPQAW
ncbi:MAG TPA: hypothetical protein VK781_04820 [Solirubrobacteraceae bacterium]|jgi:hypothetical protein|nr:hypothetical protein [Solirubrobacteraceae bacterium]